MTPADRAKYLENRRRRTHFAIMCKRTFGYWIPQTGPIEDADRLLTQMRHGLINYRAGDSGKPSDVANLVTSLRSTRDLKRTLEIFSRPSVSHHRRVMTARRIAHRLGYIEERADDHEKHKWSLATLKRWKWVTQNHLQLNGAVRLMAGTEVSYLGSGEFRYEDPDDDHYPIHLSAEQAREAGVRRFRRWR